MGRPRIKIIDDSQIEVEQKTSKKKKAKSEKTDSPVTLGSEETPESADSGQVRITQDVNRMTEDSTKSSENKVLVDDSAVKSQSEEKVKTESSKKQKPGKAKPRSKKYQEISKDLDRTKSYSVSEAVELVKKLSYSKFPGTLEAHINTAQTGIRGLVALPFASGRKLRILVFGKGAETLTSVILNGAKRSEESPTNVGLKQVERSFASAQDDTIKVGSDETIEEINKGKVGFDLIVTTPEWMPKLAKVARILGPKGLMPNPKNGTITSGEDGLKKAVEGFQAGKTEYKTESKAPVIHVAMGKLNQPNDELIANIKTLYQTIGKSRVKKITLSPTMGPGVKINLTNSSK